MKKSVIGIVIIIAAVVLLGAIFFLGNNQDENHEFIKDIQEDQTSQQATQEIAEQETRQQNRDPILTRTSQNLMNYGTDCSFENTLDTRNSLAIDPKNSNVIYVGIESKGIFKSIDGGKTWKSSSEGIIAYPNKDNLKEKCYSDMTEIIIDPKNSQRLLLAPADTSTGYIDWPYAETAGVWESLDSGESWHQLINGKVNAAGTGALAVDPNNPQMIYFGVNSDPPTFKEAPIKETLNKISPLYKSEDGGKTWVEMNIGDIKTLKGYLQLVSIFINPKNSNEILLLTQAHDHEYGENYIKELFSYTQFGPIKSEDGGKTWRALAEKLPSPYQNPFDGDVSINNFNHMIVRPFLFGNESPKEVQQKSFYSIDGGETFHETSVLIWVGRYNPHDLKGEHLIGYSPWYANGRILESRNAGATWQPTSSPPEIDDVKVKVSNIVWDPKNQDIIYISGTQGYVWKSVDSGKSWETILNVETLR